MTLSIFLLVAVTLLCSSLADLTSPFHLRIAVLEQPPFIQTTASGGYEGYCIDLIESVSSALNFTYTLYRSRNNSYGTMDDNKVWSGLVQDLLDGSADIGLGPLMVLVDRLNYIDFTVPFYELVGMTVLMKKSEEERSLFKFLTVLEGWMWLAIVGCYICTSVFLWLCEYFSPYSYRNNREKYLNDPNKVDFTIKECFWFCLIAFTPHGGDVEPKNFSGKMVAHTWWVFGFIIIAAFTANLAAFLTASGATDIAIQSIDDLAGQSKIRYALLKGSASEMYFRRMADIEARFYDAWQILSLNQSTTPQWRAELAAWEYPVSDKYTTMWRFMQIVGLPDTVEQAIQRVLDSPSTTEGFAFIGDATQIRYAAMTNCKLVQVGKEFSRKPYAIAVQKGSPLKDKISGVILQLLNDRKLEEWKNKWWNDNVRKASCTTDDTSSSGITIGNIGGAFVIIVIGIGISVIILVLEYLYYKDKTPHKTTANCTIDVAPAAKRESPPRTGENSKAGSTNVARS